MTAVPSLIADLVNRMKDRCNRTIDYMRISITDRCNLRCRYCMPGGIELVPMEQVLTYEEILSVVKEAAALGITRIKVTGGEPLVRRGCCDLIAGIKAVPGIEQVTMTTNGILLPKYLDELIDAGLDAVNISLDTLNRERYLEITRFDMLEEALEGIDRAVEAGLRVKVNSVLQKGVNDDEILNLAYLAKTRGLDVRFIELMPIGYADAEEGISNADVLKVLEREHGEAVNDDSVHGNGPAVYYRLPDFKGSIGFISAMNGRFCSSCNRIRMTAQGYIKPCLCYGEGVSVMETLRSDIENKGEAVRSILAAAVGMKPEGHMFENINKVSENRRMIQIGG